MAEIEHCRTGASGAVRWINCPTSLAMEDHFANEGSPEADEGTLGHSLLEVCLITGSDPKDYLHWIQTDFDTLENEREREKYMGWADYIHNTRNIPMVDYASKGLGPMIRISRKDTYNQMLDEFEALIEKHDIGEKSAITAAYEWLNSSKPKKFKVHVEMTLALSRGYAKACSKLGSRVMRDYPRLADLEDCISAHLNNESEEKDSDE